MTSLSIAPPYLLFLAALYFLLSVRIIAFRRSRRVGFGSGDSPDLERRVRVHGNFAEYVPFTALLLIVAELKGSPAAMLQGLWLALCGGRVFHALLLSFRRTDNPGRIIGMTGTFVALLGAAFLLAAKIQLPPAFL